MRSAKPLGGGLQVPQWTASDAKATPFIGYTRVAKSGARAHKWRVLVLGLGAFLRGTSAKVVYSFSRLPPSPMMSCASLATKVRLGHFLVSFLEKKKGEKKKREKKKKKQKACSN
jgi:hypothetical protein